MSHDSSVTQGPGAEAGAEADVVFDCSVMQRPDVGGISMLLTARLLAGEHSRRVWISALSERTRRALHALGVDGLFMLLPSATGTFH